MGSLFRSARRVGLPAPRYWASGRGVMLLASSVGTATRPRRQLSMALFQSQRGRAPSRPDRRPIKSAREEVGDACKSAYRSIDNASVLQAASLVLPLAKSAACTRYDLCGVRLGSY